MAHRPIRVANALLAKGFEREVPLTLMHLNKLIYFSHALMLAVNDDPLVDEAFQAWKFGPVLPSLYHSAKIYGADPVRELIKEDFHPHPIIACFGDREREIMDGVWDRYAGKTGFELSELTHTVGSPWEQVWKASGGRKHAIISDQIIAEYYKRLFSPVQ